MSENTARTQNADASLAQYTEKPQPNSLGHEPLPEEDRGVCPHVESDELPCWDCYRNGADVNEEVDN